MSFLRPIAITIIVLLAVVMYRVAMTFRFPLDLLAAIGISLIVLAICRSGN